jgi:hypothetical protein
MRLHGRIRDRFIDYKHEVYTDRGNHRDIFTVYYKGFFGEKNEKYSFRRFPQAKEDGGTTWYMSDSAKRFAADLRLLSGEGFDFEKMKKHILKDLPEDSDFYSGALYALESVENYEGEE